MRLFSTQRWLGLLASLSVILSSLPLANANRLAAAYERVLFYYIYREAVFTWGKQQNKYFRDDSALQIDCINHGTHQFGGCNFREFLNFLHPHNSVIGELNGVSNLNTPDPHLVAGKITKSAGLTGVFDTRRILPAATRYRLLVGASDNMLSLSESYLPPYPQLPHQICIDYYINAWPPVYNTMVDRGQLSLLRPTRDKINTALHEVLVLRASDIADNMKTALPNAIPGLQPVLIETPYAHPGEDDPQRKV